MQVDLETLERDLSSNDASRRSAAVAQLDRLQAFQLRELLSTLTGRLTRAETLLFAGPLAALPLIAMGLALRKAWGLWAVPLYAWVGWLIAGAFIVARTQAFRSRRLKRGITGAMDILTHPRFLAPLIDCRARMIAVLSKSPRSDGETTRLVEAIDRAVRRILLTAPVGAFRTVEFRDAKLAFRAWLDKPYSDLAASLRCFELIGSLPDTSLLVRVSELSTINATTPNEITVRNAATECLRVFAERKRRANAEKTLLRASNEPTGSPDTLLRAATHTPTVPANQLLGPGQ